MPAAKMPSVIMTTMTFMTLIGFFLVAMAATVSILPLIIRFAREKDLVEQTDERKIHTERVSNLGGIGIFSGFALTLLWLLQPGLESPVRVFILGLPLLLLGVIDDLYKVGVTTRFILQALLGVILFEMGFQISLMEGAWLFNYAATVLFLMLLINAFNFIDGINGLAGGLGVIGSVVFGSILGRKGDTELAMACFTYAGSLFGFLGFNFGKKARIFMGDNGSTVMGLFMAIMVLSVIKSAHSTGEVVSWQVLSGVIVIPVVDIFKVASFRVFRLRSPFSPDRTHIHHLLTDGGLSHPAACGVLLGWNLILVFLAMFRPDIFTLPMTVVAVLVPYLLAKGIPTALPLTNAPVSLPEQGTPALHTLQAN